MKKTLKWLIPVLLILGASLGYYQITQYYNTHFLPNTICNNQNISKDTLDQATHILTKSTTQQLTLKVDNDTIGNITQSSALNKDETKRQLQQELKKQNAWLWPFAYSKKTYIRFNVSKQTASKQLQQNVHTIIKQYNKDKTEAVDASLSYTPEQGFVLHPAKAGTKLDENAVLKHAQQAFTKSQPTVQLRTDTVQPSVTMTDAQVKEKQASLKRYTTLTITYQFNKEEVTIPNTLICQWITLDSHGNIQFNKTAVKAYVQQLADKYNTYKNDITFQSTKQGTVKLPCKTYSWSIDVNKETEALLKLLEKGDNVTRTPITVGSASPKGDFIGNTYIEVDKAAQHMWVYKDGKEIINTDVVTGKPESPTPTGVFYVWNKERNAVLKGEDYESPVSYWMPIDWEGVGIHDSNWQTAYGGTRWKDGFGSHGCVNTPPNIMSTIYNSIPVGTPVIILDN